MHESEEQNKGGKMEVDLVIALELWPTTPKITSSTRIFFGVTNNFDKVEGVDPILAFMLTKVITFFDVVTN
jgi:hypothetical protein